MHQWTRINLCLCARRYPLTYCVWAGGGNQYEPHQCRLAEVEKSQTTELQTRSEILTDSCFEKRKRVTSVVLLWQPSDSHVELCCPAHSSDVNLTSRLWYLLDSLRLETTFQMRQYAQRCKHHISLAPCGWLYFLCWKISCKRKNGWRQMVSYRLFFREWKSLPCLNVLDMILSTAFPVQFAPSPSSGCLELKM